MSDQFETANIIYSGLLDKGLTVFVVDEKKKNWVIWKKAYQSTEDSDAYKSLQEFKFGESFGVSYKETDEEFVGKDGKNVKFKKRTIYSIMPLITNPTNGLKPSQAPKSAPQATITPKNEYLPTQEFKPRNFAKEGYEKCLWSYWVEKKTENPLDQKEMDLVWQVFNQIGKDSDKRFNGDPELDSLANSVPF